MNNQDTNEIPGAASAAGGPAAGSEKTPPPEAEALREQDTPVATAAALRLTHGIARRSATGEDHVNCYRPLLDRAASQLARLDAENAALRAEIEKRDFDLRAYRGCDGCSTGDCPHDSVDQCVSDQGALIASLQGRNDELERLHRQRRPPAAQAHSETTSSG